MSPWTSSPWSVMLYGFTDRGCLRRRILITCMTSWTSPFSRSLNRNPMTPSETYSTRPSREDRGLSSFTSAVKMHVQQADRVDRHARCAASLDEVRELGPDPRDGRLRVRGFELHDVQFLLLDVGGQVPS